MKGREKENLATLSVPELEARLKESQKRISVCSFDIRRTR